MKTRLAIALFGAWVWPAGAQEKPPVSERIWKSEPFLRSYLGAYQPRNRIEPYITDEDREVLGRLPPLLAAARRSSAIRLLRESPRTRESAPLLLNLGSLLFEEDQWEEAVEAFTDALEIHPDFLRGHQRLGYAHVRLENPAAAIAHLQRAVELGDQSGYTFGLLGRCYEEKGNFPAAQRAFQMAQLTQPGEEAWIAGEASCRQAMGEHRRASALYLQLVRGSPENAGWWEQLGHSQLAAGDTAEAAASLEAGRRFGSKSPAAAAALATAYLRLGLPELAGGALLRAAEDPDANALQTLLSVLESLSARLPDAGMERILDRLAERVSPPPSGDDSGVRLARLRTLAAFRRDPEAHLEEIEALVAENPLDGAALLALARHHQSASAVDRAMLLAEQAAADPGHATAAKLLQGEILARTGNYREALTRVEEALVLEPSRALREFRDQLAETVRLHGRPAEDTP